MLTVEEADVLRVSPVSTAFEFFVRRFAGGEVLSDGHVDRMMRLLQSEDLFTASSLLAALARGELQLPAGFADGYALLEDHGAYGVFAENHPAHLYSTAEAIAAPFNGFTSAELGRTVGLLRPLVDLQAPLFSAGASVIEPAAQGHLVHDPGYRTRPEFSSWLDGSGALRLAPEHDGHSYMVSTASCPSTGDMYFWRYRLLEESHRTLRRGGRLDLRLVVSDWERSPVGCPELATTVSRSAEFTSAIDFGRSQLVQPARWFHGLRGMPYFCLAGEARQLDDCAFAPHRFNPDGTGIATELGAKVDGAMIPVDTGESAPFTWSLSPQGVLGVSYGEVDMRYWLVDSADHLLAGMVYVASTTARGVLETGAGYAAVIDGKAPRAFDAVSPVGSWGLASFELVRVPYSFPGTVPPALLLERTADGRSGGLRKGSWTLIDATVYDTSYRGDNRSAYYHDCESALADGATVCWPGSVRAFRPLARRGRRLYGIEEVYTVASLPPHQPPYYIHRTGMRPTYHEDH